MVVLHVVIVFTAVAKLLMQVKRNNGSGYGRGGEDAPFCNGLVVLHSVTINAVVISQRPSTKKK